MQLVSVCMETSSWLWHRMFADVLQGKNYVVLDGDIIYFKFNVTASAKK